MAGLIRRPFRASADDSIWIGFRAIFADCPGYNHRMQMPGPSVSARCASYLPLKAAWMGFSGPGGFLAPQLS